MKIHRIKYSKDGVVRMKYAASDAEASKIGTALKNEGIEGKPYREPIDVPTDKTGLIAFLNEHATVAK